MIEMPKNMKDDEDLNSNAYAEDKDFLELGKAEPLRGELIENRVMVFSHPLLNEFFERGYGKFAENRLELSFVEALYLVDKGKLVVTSKNKKTNFEELIKLANETDREIHTTYVVYKDLRERGLTIKTGYKFGCHFRVYERGVKIKRGPKEAHEHTKWIVHAVAEDYTCSFPELSRAVRLAHNIRAKMLWAIVDQENDVTYYQILRIKP
ncbi:MAG: tRNA-intron lyase [Candidatus Aenigmarchaeota archaeon]|nr:tRNA-intron lyase [Candidatus Aenigmarchaeota archaeon]